MDTANPDKLESRSAMDLTGDVVGGRHPCPAPDVIIAFLARVLEDQKRILDPFAGTGKIAMVKDFGCKAEIVCNEIEVGWKGSLQYDVDEWHFGDAAAMTWAENDSFDTVCLFPTYGNRMADHYDIQDNSVRITYQSCLGKNLHTGNTGRLKYGANYKAKHRVIYQECLRVLEIGGIVTLNISNHIRAGILVDVVSWHIDTLAEMGVRFFREEKFLTPRMGNGKNRELRAGFEHLFFGRLENPPEWVK